MESARFQLSLCGGDTDRCSRVVGTVIGGTGLLGNTGDTSCPTVASSGGGTLQLVLSLWEEETLAGVCSVMSRVNHTYVLGSL